MSVINVIPNFEVILQFKAKSVWDTDTLFVVEVDYAGLVSVDGSLSDADVERLVIIEAPKLTHNWTMENFWHNRLPLSSIVLKCRKALWSMEYVCTIWTKEAERLNINPLHHTVRLNT